MPGKPGSSPGGRQHGAGSVPYGSSSSSSSGGGGGSWWSDPDLWEAILGGASDYFDDNRDGRYVQRPQTPEEKAMAQYMMRLLGINPDGTGGGFVARDVLLPVMGGMLGSIGNPNFQMTGLVTKPGEIPRMNGKPYSRTGAGPQVNWADFSKAFQEYVEGMKNQRPGSGGGGGGGLPSSASGAPIPPPGGYYNDYRPQPGNGYRPRLQSFGDAQAGWEGSIPMPGLGPEPDMDESFIDKWLGDRGFVEALGDVAQSAMRAPGFKSAVATSIASGSPAPLITWAVATLAAPAAQKIVAWARSRWGGKP